MNENEIPGTLPEWLAPHAGEVALWGATPDARECWVADCHRDAHLHGLCKTHHNRARRAWNPRPADRPKASQSKPERSER